jgi:hypothetical protein
MDNNLATEASVITHQHRPTTIKRYYNDRCYVMVYCTDCKEELSYKFNNLIEEDECSNETSCIRTVS